MLLLNSEKSSSVSFWLPESTIEDLDSFAKENNISRNKAILIAIEEFLTTWRKSDD